MHCSAEENMGVTCALEGNAYDHVFVPVLYTGERPPMYNPLQSALETNSGPLAAVHLGPHFGPPLLPPKPAQGKGCVFLRGWCVCEYASAFPGSDGP